MPDKRNDIERRRRGVIAASGALKSASLEQRGEWLARSAYELSSMSAAAARELAESTGLSEPMVSWGLRTTLETIDETTLGALARKASASRGVPLPWLPLILAGNLFTASIRGVFVPLLLGVPVLAKASSREMVFPRLVRDAFAASDPKLAAAFDVVDFRGGDAPLEDELVRDAEIIAVYGSDETVAAVRRRHAGMRVIAHGHGVSLAYASHGALDAADTVRAFAVDVAAYDQRGCLSPQAIYVEGNLADAEAFGERLAQDGLAPMTGTLPRGPLPLEVGARQAQWRGLAEVEGRVFHGDDFAVAVVERPAFRWSPGYRNVAVIPVEGFEAALDEWTTLGTTLKCVGVDPDSLDLLAAALAQTPSLRAYACPLGSMQRPKLDAPVDGQAPWYGLLG